ncbi:MAG TPA: adenylosuccinate synthetase [Acidimicrobiales bacterium]|nr:adenylosuccinate synthetase [Acidimicrobiales bacterium]
MSGHVIVVDLSYGDAGKGTVVDWLCARPAGWPVQAVVRFNGGAQAAHHVVTADGRHHAFAQFGSGTFTPGVVTHLSRFMLVEPLALAAEARHLAALGVPDALDRITVDRRALLTTPYHRAANRAREVARGAGRHGSCGIGIGETMAYAIDHPADAPVAGDGQAPGVLRGKLRRLLDHLSAQLDLGDVPPVEAVVDAYRAFAERVPLVDGAELDRLLRAGPVVFEGAQGVLLDEWRGFHPHTTWSTTTFDNAETLLAEAGRAGDAYRLGVVRTYTTRHGAGPFVTEDAGLTAALPDGHNGRHDWQGDFRVGHFDAVAHRYAVEVCGRVDGLAVTHLDRAARHPELLVCDAYEVGGSLVRRLEPGPFRDLGYQEALTGRLLDARPVCRPPAGDWPAVIGDALGVPAAAGSWGPTAGDKAWLAPVAGERDRTAVRA